MDKGSYTSNDVSVGDEVLFSRPGIDDFRMYWKVIGFLKNMVHVEIDEMGYKDKFHIDFEDIEKIIKSPESEE